MVLPECVPVPTKLTIEPPEVLGGQQAALRIDVNFAPEGDRAEIYPRAQDEALFQVADVVRVRRAASTAPWGGLVVSVWSTDNVLAEVPKTVVIEEGRRLRPSASEAWRGVVRGGCP